MYNVDDQDSVTEIADFPRASGGAPLPSLIATEDQTFLVFRLQETPDGWDGNAAQMVSPDSDDRPLAIVAFDRCHARMFGPPNDEAFKGHPLSDRGLHPYGAFKVENSSWIRRLERMNAVHPQHSSGHFAAYNHFIFAFHDSTFECIAEGYEIEFTRNSIRGALVQLAERVG